MSCGVHTKRLPPDFACSVLGAYNCPAGRICSESLILQHGAWCLQAVLLAKYVQSSALVHGMYTHKSQGMLPFTSKLSPVYTRGGLESTSAGMVDTIYTGWLRPTGILPKQYQPKRTQHDYASLADPSRYIHVDATLTNAGIYTVVRNLSTQDKSRC